MIDCEKARFSTWYEMFPRLSASEPGQRGSFGNCEAHLSKDDLEVLGYERTKLLFLRRWSENEEANLVFNFSADHVSVALPMSEGRWHKCLDLADKKWHGSGSLVPGQFKSQGEIALNLGAKSFVLFVRAEEN